MRSVLCFGDSNTFGQVPGETKLARYGPNDRWPGVLRQHLGADWLVIEEGLSGRTTVHDDPIEGAYKNGRRYLRPCLLSHMPVDLLIIMLGTNDLKIRFNKPASEVAMGVSVLIHDTMETGCGPNGKVPEILLVAPPPMLTDLKDWQPVFAGGSEKSHELALEFEYAADSLGVHFFDAGRVVSSCPADGFHLDAEGHRLLGEALAREVHAIGWTLEQS